MLSVFLSNDKICAMENMLPAEAILARVTWTASKADVVTTLLPPHIVFDWKKKAARAFWLAGCSGTMGLQGVHMNGAPGCYLRAFWLL